MFGASKLIRKKLINRSVSLFPNLKEVSNIKLYEQCLEAYEDIKQIEEASMKNSCDSLFDESNIGIFLQGMTEKEKQQIDNNVKKLIYICSKHYHGMKQSLLVIEWLIRNFDAHIYLADDLLASCLGYYNKPFFVSFVRVLDVTNSRYSWLKPVYDSGKPINIEELAKLCLKDFKIIEMITDWSVRMCSNYDYECAENLLKCNYGIMLKILDSTKCKSFKQFSMLFNPFINVIVNGMNSDNYDFNILALHMIQDLATEFSKEVINVIKTIIPECLIKDLDGKLFKLAVELIDISEMEVDKELNNKILTKLNEINLDKAEEIRKIYNDIMEKDKCINIYENNSKVGSNNVVMTTSVKTRLTHEDIIKKCNLDFNKSNVQEALEEIMERYIVNWMNPKNEIIPINLHAPLNIMNIIMDKYKSQFEIEGRKLYGYFICCLFHPESKLKHVSRVILNKFFESDAKFNKKSTIEKDLQTQLLKTTILSEINKLCSDANCCVTIRAIAMSIINENTINDLEEYPNILNLFVNEIKPQSKNNQKVLEKTIEAISRICLNLDSMKYPLKKQIMDAVFDVESEFYNNQVVFVKKIPFSYTDLENRYVEQLAFETITNNNNMEVDNEYEDEENEKIKKHLKSNPFVDVGKLSEEINIKYVRNSILILEIIMNKLAWENEDKSKLIALVFRMLNVLIKANKNSLSDLKLKSKFCSNDDVIQWTKKIMVSLRDLLKTETSVAEADCYKIQLSDVTKLLYTFKMSEILPFIYEILCVLIQLNIGLDQFNIIELMSWLGSNIVPKEDELSLNITNSLIEETLPLYLSKENTHSYSNKLDILAQFVLDCEMLPPHRCIGLYYSLVKNLSGENDNIELIFSLCLLISAQNPNSVIVKSLIKKYTADEQLQVIKYMINHAVANVNKVVKRRNPGPFDCFSGGKRQKLENGTIQIKQNNESDISSNQTNYEILVFKIKSLIQTLNYSNLLENVVNQSLMIVENCGDMLLDVNKETIKDFMQSIFQDIKVISQSKLNEQLRNSVSQSLNNLVKNVCVSLSDYEFLHSTVEMASDNSQIQDKYLELFCRKISDNIKHKKSLDATKEQIKDLVERTLNLVLQVDINSLLICGLYSVGCVKCLLQMNLEVGNDKYRLFIESLIDNLIENKWNIEKSVEVYSCLKEFCAITMDKQLTKIIVDNVLIVLNTKIDKLDINSKFLESAFDLLMILMRNTSAIDWNDKFSVLNVIMRLSKEDMTTQAKSIVKSIRMNIAETADTIELIDFCHKLLNSDEARGKMSNLSISVSIFGCHIKRLSSLSDDLLEKSFEFLLKSIDLRRDLGKHDYREIEKVIILAFRVVFKMNRDIFSKLLRSCKVNLESDVELDSVLSRCYCLFGMIDNLIKVECNNKGKAHEIVEYLDESGYIDYAGDLINVLIGNEKSSMNSCPLEFSKLRENRENEDLLVLISNSMIRHLICENQQSISMQIKDANLKFIGSVAKSILAVESALEMNQEDYSRLVKESLGKLMIQIAVNSQGEEDLLLPITNELNIDVYCYSENVVKAIVNILNDMRKAIGPLFESVIRDEIKGFIEICRLSDNVEISCGADSLKN